MEIEIPIGEIFEMQFEVTPETTAIHLGSGSVSVLSTPSLVLFMEQVARIWLEDYIPEGHTSVGTRICVNHVKASGVGEIVKAVAKVIQHERKRVDFHVEVLNSNNEILGEGTHTRIVVEEQRFLDTIA